MNRGKKVILEGRSILRREDYKKVKKMDRQEMEEFCKNLYMNGYNDGRESVPGIDINQVKDAILETKGIGQNRLASIMESIEKRFGGKKDE